MSWGHLVRNAAPICISFVVAGLVADLHVVLYLALPNSGAFGRARGEL